LDYLDLGDKMISLIIFTFFDEFKGTLLNLLVWLKFFKGSSLSFFKSIDKLSLYFDIFCVFELQLTIFGKTEMVSCSDNLLILFVNVLRVDWSLEIELVILFVFLLMSDIWCV